MDRNLKYIAVDKIDIPEISLREVKTKSEEFQNFANSVAEYGVCVAITVIPHPNRSKEFTHLLEDGKQRLTASRIKLAEAREKNDPEAVARLEMIPCQVFDIPREEIHFRQVVLNMQKVNTTPREYAQQIQRIIQLDQFRCLSHAEILTRLNISKSPAWLMSQLNLNKLIAEAGELLEAEKIPVSAAYTLGKLPGEEQIHWLERCQTDTVDDVINDMNQRLAELKAEKKGEKKEADPFKDIKVRKKTAFRDKMIQLEQQIAGDPENKSLSSFYAGVLWAVSLDPESLEEKKTQDLARTKEREDFLAKRRERMMEAQKSIDADLKAEMRV